MRESSPKVWRHASCGGPRDEVLITASGEHPPFIAYWLSPDHVIMGSDVTARTAASLTEHSGNLQKKARQAI